LCDGTKCDKRKDFHIFVVLVHTFGFCVTAGIDLEANHVVLSFKVSSKIHYSHTRRQINYA
jgi:hypothetical protein